MDERGKVLSCSVRTISWAKSEISPHIPAWVRIAGFEGWSAPEVRCTMKSLDAGLAVAKPLNVKGRRSRSFSGTGRPPASARRARLQ